MAVTSADVSLSRRLSQLSSHLHVHRSKILEAVKLMCNRIKSFKAQLNTTKQREMSHVKIKKCNWTFYNGWKKRCGGGKVAGKEEMMQQKQGTVNRCLLEVKIVFPHSHFFSFYFFPFFSFPTNSPQTSHFFSSSASLLSFLSVCVVHLSSLSHLRPHLHLSPSSLTLSTSS